MNYIVTRNSEFFRHIGEYNYCSLEEMGKMLTKGIAVDSETTGLSALTDKVFSIQIGTGKDNFLVDLQDYSGTIKFREYEGVTQTIDEVFPYLYGRHLIFHNYLFDGGFFMKAGFIPDVEMIWDSMIASQCLYNGKHTMRHNFKACMERELGVTYDKSEQQNINRVKLSTASAIAYCFQDVDRLKELHEVLYNKLKSYGGHQTYHTNRKVLSAISYMELCGLPLNEYKWRAKMEKDQAALLLSERRVIDYIWENLPEYRTMQMDLFSDSKMVNCLLSSPSQMIPVFEKLGIDIVTDDKKADSKKGKKGESKADKALRLDGKKKSIEESVISLSDHEFVKIWLEYKNNIYRINNYGKNILDEIVDGRIYNKYKPMIDTSRLAARSEGSMNALNVPTDANLKGEDEGLTRKCFEASPGFKMIVADYSAQEAVDLADVSRDPVMLASVIEGLDLHCAFARLVYPELADLSDQDIAKNHKAKRTFVKSPRFAFSYGGSAYTVHKASGMPLEQATLLEEKFKELHYGVFDWGNQVLEQACKTGYIESADCWRLHLPDFEEFKEARRKIEGISKEMWKQYRNGKAQYKMSLEYETKGKEYEIEDQDSWDVYMEWRSTVRRYWKKRGEYFRLCLNNPIQSTGSHQIKLAKILLFKHIVKRGHLWKARLCNSIYDELVMEVTDELCDEYQPLLGEFMRTAGNYYLKSGLVKIDAQAGIGSNWYEAK
jgi:DNA polymerase I-like protein with 3'-5' exonuclease and polymerase domains